MKKKFLGFIYGVIFGISNIIPGVSGGTMMVAFGCYDIITDAMALDFKSIKRNINFLIPFAMGAAGGILGFSFVAAFLLREYPFAAYMFFIGLIIGSMPTVYRTATKNEKIRSSYIFPCLLALTLIVIMGIMQDDSTEPYGIKQSSLSDDPKTTVLTFTNLSNQTISDWIIEFEDGAVSAAGGAQLVHNKSTIDKITSMFGTETEEKPNAFIPADTGEKGYSEIKPNETITLTYVSKYGRHLELEPQFSYKMNANLFLGLLFGGFCAAVAMIIPGVSGSFIMVLFGIYATIISAIKDLDILVLLPAAIGILCGLVLGARMIKYFLEHHRMTVYSAIMGLMLGSVYVIFPFEHLTADSKLAFGIAALILGGAIALTVSMEKKSGEDLKKTSENL